MNSSEKFRVWFGIITSLVIGLASLAVSIWNTYADRKYKEPQLSIAFGEHFHFTVKDQTEDKSEDYTFVVVSIMISNPSSRPNSIKMVRTEIKPHESEQITIAADDKFFSSAIKQANLAKYYSDVHKALVSEDEPISAYKSTWASLLPCKLDPGEIRRAYVICRIKGSNTNWSNGLTFTANVIDSYDRIYAAQCKTVQVPLL